MSTEIKVTPALLRDLASNIDRTAHELFEKHKRLSQQLMDLPFQVSGRDAVLNQALYAGSMLEVITNDLKDHSKSLRNIADRFEKTDQQEVSLGDWKIDSVDLLSPFGGGVDEWKENPMGAGLTAFGTFKDGQEAYKIAQRHNQGFRASPYTNNQGKPMVRFENRTLIKDKDGNNVIRRTKLPLGEAKKIDEVQRYLLKPGALLKESLSLKNNALGYISTGLDIFKDTKENLESNASSSKIAGDIVGDIAVGVGSTAASTWAGAAVGTAIGGPIGTVIGAGVGFTASVVSSIITDGIKFDKGDWNNDGEKDSIKDRIKSGIGSALDKIF
ncbi:WXG100 family type VII secretion target [Bacillus cereus]|uniref:Type VII secretion protein n=2 Tax=Bacillus cereus TaxID=1396 RepID=A0A1S9V6K6_BACCE|nr:WXG100 family type VII secretion target [Bacillus cereus]EJR02678.1 WXG100 family type VII secretion target [Bacillus cereus MC67]EOP13579.1 WXG100 family type VII secretion target [Bacillus cereus MC118]OOR30068.1 type VII secretion protein [Bacillus cereus]